MNIAGPATPFHMTQKVTATADGSLIEMLAEDASAVQVEPDGELAAWATGMYGDAESIITARHLATLSVQCMGTSPTLRDVKPTLAEKTYEDGGFSFEVNDANESSRFGIASDRATLLQQHNRSRGGPSLNAETIAGKGVFLSNL